MPKISALSPLTSPDDADELPINDASVYATKKLPLSGLVSWLQAKLGWITTTMLADGAVTKSKLGSNLNGDVYASGEILAQNGAQYKDLTEAHNSGITKTDASTYTVVTPGIYFVHAQQLINTNANALYFEIRKNNTTMKYGYMVGNSMQDIVVSHLMPLVAGDTIRIYQSATISNSWQGGHSSYQIIMIKRT